jgi:hypothetical protein
MAFYNPNAGPYAGPLYMNAMGASPLPAGGSASYGFNAGGANSVTLSPEAAAYNSAALGGSGAGTDWLKMLQAAAPIVQQMGQQGKSPAREVPAVQAMSPAGGGNILAQLIGRQPLLVERPALPGLLG